MAQHKKVSAQLTTEAKEQIIRKIEEIKALLPFLVGLDSEERMKIRKMGPKSLGYVLDCERAARLFPDAIPPTLEIEEMQLDIKLRNDLAEIQGHLSSMMSGIDDTMMAAGSDAMITADLIYGYFKTASLKEATYQSITADIGRRFKR